MSIPKSEQKNKYIKCTIIDLLESIALEEMAISNLLNAEADKIKALVGEKLDFPFCTNIKGIMDCSRLTTDFLDKIIMKEWLLLNKLNKVIELKEYNFFNIEENEKIEKCDTCTRPLKKFCEEDK